ncbi:MAG: hypothetical protein IKC31_06775 [Clostridia bacterium]|nr:hypothetical protein [Clostridia bacterium]
MGFGYLFLGYLVTFVLRLTAEGLGVTGFALLLGYSLMLAGLWQLTRFEKSFAVSKWLLIPLLVGALYQTVKDIAALCAASVPFFTPVTDTVMTWIEFALLLAFNVSMLIGVYRIAKQVELPSTGNAALRNIMFIGVGSVLYLIGNLPLPNFELVRKYLSLPIMLLQIVWIVANLLLLLSCTKNICKAGDEEQPPKRYRWELLNKIGDAYEDNRQRSVQRLTREMEDKLRAKKEKNHRKKKKR